MGRKTAWRLDDLVPHMPQGRPVLTTMQPGGVSRCRFHHRPYNLHQGVHVTRRKNCALFFPRNKNAALLVGAQKIPLTLSGLKKMGPGWHLRPRAFTPQASVMASGERDDVSKDCAMKMIVPQPSDEAP